MGEEGMARVVVIVVRELEDVNAESVVEGAVRQAISEAWRRVRCLRSTGAKLMLRRVLCSTEHSVVRGLARLTGQTEMIAATSSLRNISCDFVRN